MMKYNYVTDKDQLNLNVVLPTTTISKALMILNRVEHKLLLVCSEFGEFIGTLSDGDIRRALINDNDLSFTIKKIIQRNAVVKTFDEISSAAFVLELNPDFRILPIVDERRLLLGYVVNKAQVNKSIRGAALIMAGGFGTRLRPLTDNCPKPMLMIHGKPILEYVLERIIKAGLKKFFISTHFMPDMIKEHFGNGHSLGVDIEYLDEVKPLGTGGCLSLLHDKKFEYPLLVSNGDVISDIDFQDLLERHKTKKCDATMVLKSYRQKIPFGVVETDNDMVKGFIEKPEYCYDINAGIYVLEECIIGEAIDNILEHMPNLLARTALKNKSLGYYNFEGYWTDVGQRSDFDLAVKQIPQRFGLINNS